jgi:hypothetical protein
MDAGGRVMQEQLPRVGGDSLKNSPQSPFFKGGRYLINRLELNIRLLELHAIWT